MLLNLRYPVCQAIKRPFLQGNTTVIRKRFLHQRPSKKAVPQSELNKPLDNYELLGVTKECSQKQIKLAYLKLAKTCHPDVSSDPESSSKFQELTAAHAILSNKVTRKQYDLDLLSPADQFKKHLIAWTIIWPIVFVIVTLVLSFNYMVVIKSEPGTTV